MREGGTEFRHAIAGGTAAVAAAQAALAAFLAAAGASPRSVTRAELVLEELALNALRHGGAPSVQVRARLEAGRCSLVLEDAGLPFDPTTAAPMPLAASLAEARIGGLGLALVRRTAEALRYLRTPAGLNRLEVDLAP